MHRHERGWACVPNATNCLEIAACHRMSGRARVLPCDCWQSGVRTVSISRCLLRRAGRRALRPSIQRSPMPNFDTYIFFTGQCAEAMRFYERTLGGKIEMLMTYADAPAGASAPECAAPDHYVMHARMVLQGRALMASDQPPGAAAQAMSGFCLSMQYGTADEARRIFDRLAEGGKV